MRRVDGVAVRCGYRRAGRVGVTDDRGDRMADTGDRPEPGEETEERWRDARAELQALALLHEVAVRELVADHVGARRRLVHDGDPGLELPRAGEKRRKIDPGVPVDGGAERLIEKDPPSPALHRRVGDVDFLSRVADDVIHR